MALLAARAGMAAAQDVAQHACALLPEQKTALLTRLAGLYEQHGDARRAAALYRSLYVAGPCDAQRALREHVLQLEAAQAISKRRRP
jgi:hypothetical protein